MIDHATDCRIVFGHCTCRPKADPADMPRNGDTVELRDCPVCGRMQYRDRKGDWIHAYTDDCWAV